MNFQNAQVITEESVKQAEKVNLECDCACSAYGDCACEAYQDCACGTI